MSFPDLHTDDDGTVRFNDPVSPDDGVIPSDIKKLLRERGLYSSVLTDALTTARPMIDVSGFTQDLSGWSTTLPWGSIYTSDCSTTSTINARDVLGTTSYPAADTTEGLDGKFKIKEQLVEKCVAEIKKWKQIEANTEDDYLLGICYGTIQAYQNMKDYVEGL
ncbi:MAG: hypothetical protein J5725_12075 [Bacteroidales bacterium]|nr:hypothetical protein [Bacteroidales bacterium]